MACGIVVVYNGSGSKLLTRAKSAFCDCTVYKVQNYSCTLHKINLLIICGHYVIIS